MTTGVFSLLTTFLFVFLQGGDAPEGPQGLCGPSRVLRPQPGSRSAVSSPRALPPPPLRTPVTAALSLPPAHTHLPCLPAPPSPSPPLSRPPSPPPPLSLSLSLSPSLSLSLSISLSLYLYLWRCVSLLSVWSRERMGAVISGSGLLRGVLPQDGLFRLTASLT